MAKVMWRLAVVALGLTAALAAACIFLENALLLSLAITFGTTAYHLCMRLLVGHVLNAIMKNRADPTKWWFRPRSFEAGLYRRLRVKRWKKHFPSYAPQLFSLEVHSYSEIAQAMCQAELVHEIIFVLSFLPLFTVPWFGAFPVFLITSLLAALFDLCFVLLQRYNRPRILSLASRSACKASAHPL